MNTLMLKTNDMPNEHTWSSKLKARQFLVVHKHKGNGGHQFYNDDHTKNVHVIRNVHNCTLSTHKFGVDPLMRGPTIQTHTCLHKVDLTAQD